MEYCEKNVYVREALIAKPHKYSEGDKVPLREHVAECETCQASIDEAREFAESMDRDFEY